MNLDAIKDSWDKKASTTPVASMLAADMGHIKSVDQLFAQGEQDVDALMGRLQSLNIDLRRTRALDFGCGLGRITQALADHFDEVCGLDISPAFIKLAARYNRRGSRCRYAVNERDDLRLFPDNSFDLIWCYGVLHVLETSLVTKYIAEFFRVAAPGCLIVFHQTDRPAWTLKGVILRCVPRSILDRYYHRHYGFAVHGMPRASVVDAVQGAGGRVVHVEEERKTPGRHWLSYQYYARKSEPARS